MKSRSHFRKLAELNSWNNFFAFATSLNEKEKGDIFEDLTKLILTTKPEYSTILKNVWIQREGIPTDIREKLNLPYTDEGIDLIAETFSGEFWAIQCKFKGQNQAPTYKELSTFANLANSYCNNISLALLVHTGEKGVRKKKLLGENYSEIGLDFWLGLVDEDWTLIHKYLKGQSVRPTPKTPRPHQQKAIEKAVEHFVYNDSTRGRLIMPCGTGKSLTAFWIAKELESKSIVVVVPSLALIKQSLENWTREFLAHKEEPRPEWLVICSDESTSNLDQDDFVVDAYSLGIPTTTKVEEISQFLSAVHEGRIVIFTTYQSSDRLAQAAIRCKFIFDFAILDEAHKTVGIKTKSFATLLQDENINISKRMFMTATERVIRGSNDEVSSMDDTDIYGEQFYRLSFKDAIHSDPPIISDYKILTIGVTHDEIAQLVRKNKLITDQTENIEEEEAQSLAAAIALRKATQEFTIKHAISFHRSIRGAANFSNLNRRLNDNQFDDIYLKSNHISSKKSAGERVRLLTDFANDELALMTNARCLTEGVDVPAIDCVLFADPKQSIIDIVQAAGRALRPYAGKQCGYIMLPLIVPDDVSFDEFAETTPFKVVARIIAALSTHDESIAEEFRITNSGKQISGGKINFLGTVPLGYNLDLRHFADKVSVKIWERVAKANWRDFFEAREFVKTLNFSNIEDWLHYCKSGGKPVDIPSNPHLNYKNQGWKSWGDWLGTGKISNTPNECLPFDQARLIVQGLKLKSKSDWKEYARSGTKPLGIPNHPDRTYKGMGWIDFGDWLGDKTIVTRNRKYAEFLEARSFVQQLNLKDYNEWKLYCQSGKKPEYIPTNPNVVYKNQGWSGIGDWLGTGRIATYNRKYLPYSEASALIHELKLKNVKEWREYSQSGNKPEDIPAHPEYVYGDDGWVGYGEWLGTGAIAAFRREYFTYDEAKSFVHELKLKTAEEWFRYCKSGNKPSEMPNSPSQVYKHDGWTGYRDWLGYEKEATRQNHFLPYNEARAYVNNLKLRNQAEWLSYCKSGVKPKNIPSNPQITYKNNGWLNSGDWFGNGVIATAKRQYLPFSQAKQYVHRLNLSNAQDWRKFCKSGKKPSNIPVSPNSVYKDKGWTNWFDWLGKAASTIV